ncbi:MAG: CotH kinase family protein, partial [Dehalococcoidales bacterium]|nr:CotH kinase family protein [Dehalococcoidales bacterium]
MVSRIRAIVTAVVLALVLGCGLGGCRENPARHSGKPDVDIFDTSRVATVRIEMDEKDWQYCLTHAFEESYVPANFWLDGELVPFVAVRPKGNSSLGQAVAWNSPRLPLAVDFNFFNRARSLHGVKKVFLNNGWSDPTLMREVLAYEIFARMGMPTPRSTFVDLWVNDSHLGVYTMTEMVDATFLRRHFADPNGNLYKPELVSARLDWTEKDAYTPLGFMGMPMPETPRHDPVLYTNLGGAPLLHILKTLGREDTVAAYEPVPPAQGNAVRGLPAAYFPRNRLDGMMLKTNENNPDHSALFRFLEVLNNEPDETFVQEIEKVLDVDQVLRFIAVSCVIVHLDNYIGAGHNNYIYEAGGKFTVIPWDTNMAFGTFSQGIRKDGLINFYIDEPTAGPVKRYPLVYRLLSQPAYK